MDQKLKVISCFDAENKVMFLFESSSMKENVMKADVKYMRIHSDI